MEQDRDAQDDGTPKRQSLPRISALRHSLDCHAARRAHMREMTTARQAAERHQAQLRSLDHSLEQPARQAATRERTAQYQREMARIDAEHQSWMHAHGVHITTRPSRIHVPQAAPPPTEQPASAAESE